MQVLIPPLTFLLSSLYYSYNVTDYSWETNLHVYRNSYNSSGLLWWRLWLKPVREDGSGIYGAARYVWADTKGGKVKGTRQLSRNGRPFAFFRGIPYAKPPIGERRYEPPEPHDGWEGEWEATKYGPQCLQINMFTRRITGNESCLYLNVATRKAYTKDKLPGTQDLHPVIFFIHGGLFMFGSANPFGPKYFLDEDVVLVSMNYRLNSFGFLNSGDGVIGGNMGLKDQNLALRWVQENIKFFNGDPKRVTLLGESAGAACVHLHTLSPMSWGLFSGAVSLSGTALSPWGQILDPKLQSQEFAEELNCPTNDTRAMKSCLQSLPAEQVASYHLGYMYKATRGKQTIFGPTVEYTQPRNSSGYQSSDSQVFLSEHPLEILNQGKVSETPWINGVNSADGLVYLIAIIRNDSLRQTVVNRWNDFGPQLLGYRNHPERDLISKEVKDYYLNGSDIDHDNIRESGQMFSDRGFFVDSHDVAILQSKVAPVYIYYYSYEGVCSLGNLFFTRAPYVPNDMSYMFGGGMVYLRQMLFNRREKSEYGVFHGDEMPLLFSIPFIRRQITPKDEDYNMSRKLVALFTSFAETGKPDTKRKNVDEPSVTWETVKETNPDLEDVPLKRLELNEPFSVTEEPFYDRMLFWKNRSVSYICSTGQECVTDKMFN